MIRLSMEIPTAYLSEWSAWTDLDFVLAHRVLEDAAYAEFHARRPIDRELILDNSMHELGEALPVSDLVEAAKRCRADVIIPPDALGEPKKNVAWYAQTVTAFDYRYAVGCVLCGRDSRERLAVLNSYKGAPILFLPYRESRLTWYLELEARIRRRFKRIHLLGVNTLDEVRCFASYSADDSINWSVDTAKPIKWGVALESLKAKSSIRGASLSSKDLLDLRDLSAEQLAQIDINVRQLREFLG
jgi:hypothetical protein